MGLSPSLPAVARASLEAAVSSLRATLGANLRCCAVYGSAVRGGFSEASDVNLLLVLERSTPDAHAAIADALPATPRFSTLILSAAELPRTARVFPSKFASVRRHLEVLHGEDPFRSVEPKLDRALVEQAARNLRLRLVFNFVSRGKDARRYGRFLRGVVPIFFTALADVLRLDGREVPTPFAERAPVLAEAFRVDRSALDALLQFRAAPRALTAREIRDIHAGLFAAADAAVAWIEKKWPTP